ncbi:salicylate 1-monooxygenase [Coccidioides immitis RMSCC 3703]|uniref:Salicylate 1-monooxygenase n=1 Tax=Coccidioides immitis RMSCC 3703 TaxID=454286 RepID=A0A0J8QLT0_COCIT|nr:salicylate 1-monooxygenase [Coccidioides immitis RMSCC 3703]
MSDTATREGPLDIAIVGSGIVGVVLAVGLIRQKIKVKVYEQAQGFREIGAAWHLPPTQGNRLEQADQSRLQAGDEQIQINDYLRWIDGHITRKDDPSIRKMLFKIDAGYKGFEGCRRDRFLEELVKILPADVIQCRKRLDTLEEKEGGGKIRLIFCDGTTAEADAVIGCDGIKSRVREIILGEGNPASYAHYTHKIAYRGLIPMAKAIEVLGEYKARNQHIHVGPNAHLIHYPVANQTMINATAFVSDPEEWPDDKRTVAPAIRKDVEDAFEGWSPCVRGLVSQLPEKLDKWAVFDLWDYPAPFYNRGKICLAGDAAHASSPHHGAGACMGIEDVLCLCTLMGEARVLIQKAPTIRDQALISVFDTFNSVRRTRSQWLVNSSRRVCDLYHQPEWADPAKWVKAETCFEEIKDRSHKIWHFDYNVMLQEATQGYKQSLEALIGAVSGL